MSALPVTLVVSVKDQFGCGAEQLRALRATTPGAPVLLVLSGPMGASTEREIREEAARRPDLEILDSGLDFANPSVLRNLAIPRIRTPLAMFLYNDVFPRSPDWLSALVRVADAHPEAAILQPFVWEGDEEPHSAWSDLYFLDDGAALHYMHPFDTHHVAPDGDPRPQPFFIEDHALLVRADWLAAQSLFDPGCAYAKEYLDLALTARYRGTQVLSVPKAQVVYRVPARPDPGDLLHFAFRRNEEICAASVAQLCRKWGIDVPYDGVGRHFLHENLSGALWSGTTIPDDPRLQRRMALAWFVAVGYNRFDGVDLPSFFPRFEEGPRVDVEMTRSTSVPAWPDFTPDYAERRESLRRGELFHVERATAPVEAIPGAGLFYRPFVVAEVSGFRGSEQGILELLGPQASMIVREAGDAAEGRYRAWLQGPYLPEERGVADALVASARCPWPGAELRWHRSDEGRPVSTRATFGAPGEGWRLVHWTWPRRPFRSLLLSLGGPA